MTSVLCVSSFVLLERSRLGISQVKSPSRSETTRAPCKRARCGAVEITLLNGGLSGDKDLTDGKH